MHKNIGKLLPVDGFEVIIQGELRLNYHLSLTHFYQPLIGIEAVSLYQTLVSEVLVNANGKKHTHHVLMNYMNLSLDKIYQAKLKLEGIGLLRTYKSEEVNGDSYLYKLISPFTPADFLEDGMLSQLLLHHLGEAKFIELSERFKHQEKDGGKEVTAGFNDVFSTTGSPWKKADLAIHPRKMEQNLHSGPKMENGSIEIEEMKQSLRKRMIDPATILTPHNIKLITQMRGLYELPSHEIENAVMWAIDENHLLNREEFKSACHDLSFAGKTGNKVTLKEISHARQPEESGKVPADKESQFIHMLENISPKQLLEDLSGGNEASTQDLKIIRDIMSQQGLSTGVMNVLVHYVLLKTDMKLSKGYMEKIASHWARKNVQTVRQAMHMAKAENQKYQQWSKTDSRQYKPSSGKEIIPDWFKERKKKNEELEKKKADIETTEPEEDITAMIKSYLENK